MKEINGVGEVFRAENEAETHAKGAEQKVSFRKERWRN